MQWDTSKIKQYEHAGPRYTAYPSALLFHEEVSEQDYYTAIEASNAAKKPLSLYFHIPFCNSVCFYCACNRIITANKEKAQDYLSTLYEEIAMRAEGLNDQRPVTQLHWGGGTPTYISDSQMTELVYRTAQKFHLLSDDQGDYSIEIDPRTVDRQRITLIRGLGFNRISLGVQDLDVRVQHAINRIQPVEQIESVLENCREQGFKSINMDLIYGLPWQSVESLTRTIEKICQLKPDRIALYSYAHMPERFKVQRQIDEVALPSSTEKLQMLYQAGQQLSEAGYGYIGMDHFALPHDELYQAQQSGTLHRNFQGYTTHGDADLIGMGVSSISQIGNLYLQNHKSLSAWQDAIELGHLPIQRGYLLTRDDEIRRDVIMKLISNMTLDIRSIETRWDIRFADYFAESLEALAPYFNDGLLELNEQHLQVTATGRLLVRGICQQFDRYYLDNKRSRQPGDTRYSRII